MLGSISLSKKGKSTEYGAEAWTLAYYLLYLATTGGRQDGHAASNVNFL
jgi:hypothetical protein